MNLNLTYRHTNEELVTNSYYNSHMKNAQEEQNVPEWKTAYDNLILGLSQKGIHPLVAESYVIKNTLRQFMKIFTEAPNMEKIILANKPLFLKSTIFNCPDDYNDPECNIESTTPLNYIFFQCDYDSLLKLDEHLKIDDYLALGPYGSTFLHCLISGFLKGPVYENSDAPVNCVKFLLKKEPKLAIQTNKLQTTPLKYIEYIYNRVEKKYTPILDEIIVVLEEQAKQFGVKIPKKSKNPIPVLKNIDKITYPFTYKELELINRDIEKINTSITLPVTHFRPKYTENDKYGALADVIDKCLKLNMFEDALKFPEYLIDEDDKYGNFAHQSWAYRRIVDNCLKEKRYDIAQQAVDKIAHPSIKKECMKKIQENS